jgi:cytoskeletal protein RodZ
LKRVLLPKNVGKRPLTYSFGLIVAGNGAVHAKPVKVKVAVGAGGSAGQTKPTVTGFTATPASVTTSDGNVELTANVTNAISCTFSTNKLVTGLPVTVP